MMDTEEYKALGQRLRTMEDVKRLAREKGLDEELLLVIYTHSVTRNATKSFYRVKAKAKHLVREWENGRSLLDLANKNRFPPVLMAYIIMMERNLGRKTFWKYVRTPETVPGKRLKHEIMEVVREDHIYSPRGNEIAAKRGRDGEDTMMEILDHFKISYLTEKDLRGQSTKTPDFLLHAPLVVDGRTINWIESKANFGDLVEVRKNNLKQLQPYVKLFGPGMVVYWFGFVSDAPVVADIMMVDGEFIKEVFSPENWCKRVKVKEGVKSPCERIGKGAPMRAPLPSEPAPPPTGPPPTEAPKRKGRRRRKKRKGKKGWQHGHEGPKPAQGGPPGPVPGPKRGKRRRRPRRRRGGRTEGSNDGGGGQGSGGQPPML
jgi:hypothetical protein